MNAFAKLYATCVNDKLNRVAIEKKLRAEAQGGFRKSFRLED